MVATDPMYAHAASSQRLRADRSAHAPTTGSRNSCSSTEAVTQAGK